MLFHTNFKFNFFIGRYGHVSCFKEVHQSLVMTARGFRVASFFLNTKYIVCCLFICLKQRILFKSENACIKCVSFVVCCQTTSLAVHRQYTTCTCTKMSKVIQKVLFTSNEIKIIVTYVYV
jgi:hypothetical protein